MAKQTVDLKVTASHCCEPLRPRLHLAVGAHLRWFVVGADSSDALPATLITAPEII
jgi:hypothetical protein